MANHNIVTREEWLKARKELLANEKEFDRQRDALSAARRELPMVKIDKDYRFQGPNGEQTFGELFDGRRQLIVYHFMFGPDWEEGCKSCSFWADNFNGITVHLKHRDINMVAISRAPLEKLQAYKKRMGWDFQWYSSLDSDFNFDFNASFTPEQLQKGEMEYNYQTTNFPVSESHAISVFYKNDNDEIFHTYSTYSRGLDMLNGAYHYMDLTPIGRNEDGLSSSMAWLRRRDQYED